MEVLMNLKNESVMKNEAPGIWANRFDGAAVFFGALVPIGIVVGNAGFEAMVSMTGLCWIIRSILAKSNPIPALVKHPLLQGWLAFYGCILVSLLWNGPGSKGWSHDVVLIRHLLFFAAFIDISKRRNVIRPLIMGLGAGVLWAALNALLAYSIGHDLIGKSIARYENKLKEGERIASFAAYAGPFFLAWGLLAKDLLVKRRMLLFGIGGIACILLVVFHIRTAQLGAICGILAAVALYLLRSMPRKVAITLFLSAVLFMGAGARYANLDNLAGIHSRIRLGSMYDRINIWKVSWAMWKDHPVLGVSVSGWKDAYKKTVASVPPYVSPDGRVIRASEAMHCHNLYLQILSSLGIVGSLCFCWFFVNIIRCVFSGGMDGWRSGLSTWPAVFLVIGLTGWNIFGAQYLPIFAYFLALTAISYGEKQFVN